MMTVVEATPERIVCWSGEGLSSLNWMLTGTTLSSGDFGFDREGYGEALDLPGLGN